MKWYCSVVIVQKKKVTSLAATKSSSNSLLMPQMHLWKMITSSHSFTRFFSLFAKKRPGRLKTFFPSLDANFKVHNVKLSCAGIYQIGTFFSLLAIHRNWVMNVRHQWRFLSNEMQFWDLRNNRTFASLFHYQKNKLTKACYKRKNENHVRCI